MENGKCTLFTSCIFPDSPPGVANPRLIAEVGLKPTKNIMFFLVFLVPWRPLGTQF